MRLPWLAWRNLEESPWEQLKGQLVLGSEELVEQIRNRTGGRRREQPQSRALAARATFGDVVKAVEGVRREKWEAFRDRHGDWGREVVLWLGRRECRMKLGELGALAGGMDYAAVSVAVKRFEQRLARDSELRRLISEIKRQIVEC